MSAVPIHAATSSDAIRLELEEVLKLQRAAYFAHPYPSFAERKADLLKLKALILDNCDAICAAISADFGQRSPHETKLLDIFGFVTEINHSVKHLKKWMKPRKKAVSIWFQPALR